MRAHWSSVSSWNRDTIPGFQTPTEIFIRHALALKDDFTLRQVAFLERLEPLGPPGQQASRPAHFEKPRTPGVPSEQSTHLDTCETPSSASDMGRRPLMWVT